MPITNKPASSYISDLTAPAPHGDGVGGATAWFEQLLSFVLQLWGSLFEAAATLASDTFSPTQAAYVLSPESGTSDNLATIGAGFDGMVLRVRPSTGNTITVKNASGGAGQILIADNADFVMSDPTMRLKLIYSASAQAWIEEDRMYGANKAAFTAWLNVATTALAGIVKLASITTARLGTATDSAVTPDILASFWQKGADVASATTLVKPSDTNLGGYHVITGTVPVTAMWGSSLQGEEFEFEAAAALPLTNGANFVLLTGADITCAAGDRFRVRYFGSSVWKMVSFQRADGTPLASATKRPPVRQTVFSGPVDANGLPNFGGSTGGTTVTVSGILIAAAANGFDTNGPVDRIGSITNPSWTGLSTNGTMYLYLDIAADGTCTPGATTLKPTYQFGGSYPTTSGQFTFNVQEMVGKVGNGGTATQTYRVFVGEVTVAAAVVSAITWYALQGRYLSPLTPTLPGLSASVAFHHNIGCEMIVGPVLFVAQCISAELGFAAGDRKVLQNTTGTSFSDTLGMALNRTVLTIGTGSIQNFITIPATGGAEAVMTAAKWSYGAIVNRGW